MEKAAVSRMAPSLAGRAARSTPSNRAPKRSLASVLVLNKRRSTEQLLGELERAYVGLNISPASSHHSAEA